MILTRYNGGHRVGSEEASVLEIDTGEHKFHLYVDKDGALLLSADDPFKDVSVQPTLLGIGDDMIGLKLRTE